MTTPAFVLRYTNNYKEVHYFVRHGMEHKGILLIDRTTPDIDRAVKFDSYPNALAAWTVAGEPPGWEVVPA